VLIVSPAFLIERPAERWVEQRARLVAALLGPAAGARRQKLLDSLPTSSDAWHDLELGFDRGARQGVFDGVKTTAKDFAELVKTLFDFSVEVIKWWFSEDLSEALLDDIRNLRVGFESSLWRSFSRQFRRLAAVLEMVYAIDRQVRALPAWIAHDPLATLDVFVEVEIALVTVLRETADDFLDGIHARRDRPAAQGEYLGHITGRILVEVSMFVLPELVAARRLGAVGEVSRAVTATSEVVAAERLVEARPAIQSVVATAEGIRGAAIARGATQAELALGEAYLAVTRANLPYAELKDLTGAFNKLWAAWSKSSGERAFIRLDAHHIVEKRFHKFVMTMQRERPEVARRFVDDLNRLGWATEGRMEAVALEMEFHINTGSTLAAKMEEAGADLVVELGEKYPEIVARGGRLDPASAEGLGDLTSLTDLLQDQILSFEKYENVAQVLDAYEAFYKQPHLLEAAGGKIKVSPLWRKVEPTFRMWREKLRSSN
jgi:hypothetical protein